MADATTNPLLAAALRYAEFGWRVVPLHPRAKNPRPRDWPNAASADPGVVGKWWREVPTGNVGVALGSGSGLVAIDVDTEEGAGLLAGMAGGGGPPATCEMTTGKGSRLLYAIPDGLEVEPRTVVLKGADGGEALRLQGQGGQCVVPPSVHPTGKVYAWVEGRSPEDLAPAPMPDWLLAEMCRPEAPAWVDPPTHGPADSYAPGAEFNRRGSWDEVLGAAGYRPGGRRGEVRYFTRPGKRAGVSVTLGHYRARDGSPALYVFSGNCHPLAAGKCYDLFGAYTRLAHRGDFAAAARELAARGFGTPRPARNGHYHANGKYPGNGTPPPDRPSGSPLGRGLETTRLDTIDPQPVRWLVPGYIPLGKLVLFAGDGGHGKTTLTLHLTACVTTGRPCFGLDYPAPAPAEVLIASCEDDFADTVVPRLVTVGGDRAMVRRVDGVSGPDGRPLPFSLAHFRQLEEDLEDNPRVKLVVIDPAGAYIGGAGVDDHKDSELRSLLGPLAELAARRHVTILLVKHLNKGATSKAVHRVGGSAGYVNAVRAAFVIAPDPDDIERKVFVPLKFNISKKPPGIAYRLQAVPEDQRETILDHFPTLGPADREELGRQLFRPAWDGPTGVDADTALAEHAQQQQPSRVAECREWLVGFLGGYAWPDGEVVRAAADKGFTEDNVRKAKTVLRKAGEMYSRPSGAREEWWNWLGGKNDRPGDRPTPYRGQTEETEETEESGERVPFGSSDCPIPD